MIIEGLVTTLEPDGELHVAPMGPEAEEDFARLTLRPFRTSRTFQNLEAHREGVFHVVDEVELLARAAIGPTSPPVRPAERVRGFVLLEACRYFEFRVEDIDAEAERARIECRVVAGGRLRDFAGFNRARHAVLEAAILATRAGFLPLDRVRGDMARLSSMVEKTGGPKERAAFDLLACHLERVGGARGGPERAPAAVRVRAPSRLHFGLLAPADPSPRRFGAVGAMVRDPGLELVAAPADRVSAHGPLAGRAAEFALRALAASPARAARIEVRRAPPEHVGLGTGTQLGMAAARALAELAGERDLTAAELARRSGRGERSGVGIHGFASGGLLVDGGKGRSGAPAPLVARVEVPSRWRFLLLLPRAQCAPRGLSGEAEREAFRRLERSPALSEAMARAVLLGLLPAALEEDLPAFGEALSEIQSRAGEWFAGVQGGPFASRELEAVVRAIHEEGARGSGQSSWGPTLFAVVESEERAAHLARRLLSRFPRLDLESWVSPPASQGASVEAVPDPVAVDPGGCRPPAASRQPPAVS